MNIMSGNGEMVIPDKLMVTVEREYHPGENIPRFITITIHDINGSVKFEHIDTHSLWVFIDALNRVHEDMLED